MIKVRLFTISILLPILLIVFSISINGQNVGINSTGAIPNSSAMLDIDVSAMATKKGLLIPRMTAAEKTAMNPLPAAAQGLIIYQTDGLEGFYYNTSTTTTPSWSYMFSSTNGGWTLTGNSGTAPGTNFIGTTDEQDVVFKRNKVKSGLLDSLYGNTSWGVAALYSNTTGTDNTANGFKALYLNTIGNNNVALGYGAGFSNSVGNSNVFLGYNAGYNETGSNKLYIANNSTDPPLIYGDFSTGNVGIGTKAPISKLEVVDNPPNGIRKEAINCSIYSGPVTPHDTVTGIRASGTNSAAGGGFNPWSIGVDGYGNASSNATNGIGVGIRGNAINGAISIGVMANSLGSGDVYGLYAIPKSLVNTSTIYGVYSDLSSTFGNTAYGFYTNTSPANASITNTYGMYSILINSATMNCGIKTRVANAQTCYGANFLANSTNGLAINYGVYSEASGGATNWAGYFVGNEYLSGNFGIGTTSPAEKLHVVGNIRTSSLAGIGTRMVQADANGTFVPMAAGTASQVLLGTGVWGSVPGGGNNWSITGNALTTPGTGVGQHFIGTTDAKDIVVATNSSERIRVLSTGNVGIGISNPDVNLHIKSTVSTSDIINPGAALLKLESPNIANTEWGILFQNTGASKPSAFIATNVIETTNNSTYMYFGVKPNLGGSNPTIRLTLASDGKLGVGQMWPVNLIDIRGNASIGATYSGTNTAPVNGLIVEGSVGIGSTNPMEKLHVVGNIRTSSLAGIGTRMVQADANGTFVPMAAGTASQVLLGTGVWGSVPGGGNNWSITGNALTTPGTGVGQHFIGTTDAKDIVVATNSSERIRVLSTGNVGIGTTTPTELLHVTRTSDANKSNIFGYASQLATTTDYQNRAIVGIAKGGNSSWGYSIGVAGIADQANSWRATGVYAGLGTVEPSSLPGDQALYANGANLGYSGIFMNGNVGIGLPAPVYQLQLSLDQAAKPSTNTWTIASDIRLKKDISPFTDGLNVILQINPVKYKYNGLAGMPTETENIGIIAQDMQKIAPYTVGTFKFVEEKSNNKNSNIKESEYLSFNSHALTFVTINAIKEQQKQIDELKAIIVKQQKQIEELLKNN